MKIFILFSITITSSVLCIQNEEKREAVPMDDLDNSGATLCEPYKPSVPNFSSPGKRISEEKCMEYIWHMSVRHEQQKRQRECIGNYLRNKFPSGSKGVLGGRSMPSGEYPHMGAVGWKSSGRGSWVFKCGSALISPKFLLTAAHCSRTPSGDLSVSDPLPKIVRLGVDSADGFSNYHLPHDENISKIIVHPMYSHPKKYNDIAVIELTREVVFSKFVQPACLWTMSNISSLTKITETGWDVFESNQLRRSPELKATQVDFIGPRVCSTLLLRYCNQMWCGLHDLQMCAGKMNGAVTPCQGVSGGPLQVKIRLNVTDQGSLHYLVGVASFRVGCALPNKPGVYTRVSSYIYWIESIVWPDKRCVA